MREVVTKEALKKANVKPELVDEVIMGNGAIVDTMVYVLLQIQ